MVFEEEKYFLREGVCFFFFVLADLPLYTFWTQRNFLDSSACLFIWFLGLWPIPQMEEDDLNVKNILFLTKSIKIIIR